MLINERQLLPDAFVQLPDNSGQVGKIVELEEEGQWIVIDFKEETNRRVARKQVLQMHLVPFDGFLAGDFKDHEGTRELMINGPLRLVASALIDFKSLGKSSKASDLKSRLGTARMLPDGMTWENWWNRVRPAIKEAPDLRESKGNYSLSLSVRQSTDIPLAHIPDPPRPASTKTKQPARPVSEVVAGIISGELGFTEIKGTAEQRKVFRALQKSDDLNWLDEQGIPAGLLVAIPTARMVGGELFKSHRDSRWIDIMGRFCESITADINYSGEDGDQRRTDDWVKSRVQLIETLWNYVSENQSFAGNCGVFAGRLTGLWLALRGSTTRYEDASSICEQGLVSLLTIDHSLISSFAARFSDDRYSSRVRSEALESLFNRIDDRDRLSVIREMWCVGPGEAIDLGWRILTRSTEAGRLPEIIAQEIEKTFEGIQSELLVALAEYINRLGQTGPDLKGSLISHQLMLASLDPGASRQMGSSLVSNLEAVLATDADQTADTEDSGSGDILDSMVFAMRNVMAVESVEQLQVIDSLQSRIEELEADLESSGVRQSRAESANERLIKGYRLPEQQAEANGQKNVLEAMAKYHQQLERAKFSGNLDRETVDWLLRLFWNTETDFQVELIGSPGESATFDPDIHTYRTEEEGDGGSVLLETSALVWHDPNGKKIVLARAQVKPS
jgi:molecular chaperone GrpE (heat shock protein)